jgi:hypothetical protein
MTDVLQMNAVVLGFLLEVVLYYRKEKNQQGQRGNFPRVWDAPARQDGLQRLMIQNPRILAVWRPAAKVHESDWTIK